MKRPRILDRVPLPLVRNELIWKLWCAKVSDEVVDCFGCLQRDTVFSDALYSSTMTVVYLIPGQGFGKEIDKITIYDVLYKAIGVIGLGSSKVLFLLSQLNTFYKISILDAFQMGLYHRGITLSDWCKVLPVDYTSMQYWIEIGTPIPIEYERVVKEWMALQNPWPLTDDVLMYLKQVLLYNYHIGSQESDDELE